MIPDRSIEVPAAERLGRVHFVGIGGIGMSGIARLLRARGLEVSGSDATDSEVMAGLRDLGITAHVGHDAGHLDGASTVVVSSAIREGNPELVEARRRGLLVLHRSQALAALMAGRRVVAVAGTHGKTTTTSMVTVGLRAAGLDPSFAIGGELPDGGSNAGDGSGDVLVAEADESDGSFLLYAPAVAVVTNVEPDHLDHYGTAEAVEAAFDAFCARIVPGGTLVIGLDDPGARRLLDRVRPDLVDRGVLVVGYGESEDADLRVGELSLDGEGPRFIVTGAQVAGRRTGGAAADRGLAVTLRVPGRHNVLDATAALAACVAVGAEPAGVLDGLAAFRGARRRFEARGRAAGVRVIDDYAHHPTEVEALLRAAREVAGSGRVVAVFQPHLFSRTRIFAADFGRALGLADEVVVMDVYPAREDPEPGVTGALVAERVPLPAARVDFVPERSMVASAVASRARAGDVVLTVGAGDVTALAPEILAALGRPGGESSP